MKTIFACLLLIAVSTTAFAYDTTTITFSITSSARTSIPNLRIGEARGTAAYQNGQMLQGMPIPRPVNYYMTKAAQVYTLPNNLIAIEIQVDQDTKMYTGSDLTNFMLLKSGTATTYTIR